MRRLLEEIRYRSGNNQAIVILCSTLRHAERQKTQPSTIPVISRFTYIRAGVAKKSELFLSERQLLHVDTSPMFTINSAKTQIIVKSKSYILRHITQWTIWRIPYTNQLVYLQDLPQCSIFPQCNATHKIKVILHRTGHTFKHWNEQTFKNNFLQNYIMQRGFKKSNWNMRFTLLRKNITILKF